MPLCSFAHFALCSTLLFAQLCSGCHFAHFDRRLGRWRFGIRACSASAYSAKKQPAKIILLAPWLDIALRQPQIPEIEQVNPLIDSIGLRKAGEVYRGELEEKDPRVSPLYGEMKSLGHLSIFISTHDQLWADCHDLHHSLLQQGIRHHYFEYPQMFHDWMMVVSLPKSKLALCQIVDLILHETDDADIKLKT